jgi:hypothetical protein
MEYILLRVSRIEKKPAFLPEERYAPPPKNSSSSFSVFTTPGFVSEKGKPSGFSIHPRGNVEIEGGENSYSMTRKMVFSSFSFSPGYSILSDFGLPQTDRPSPARAKREVISDHGQNVNRKKN